MKLVAAKCPSCGAQIDVDQNSDSTVCDYCNSKIIVEDAIEKYKFEISGSIEIENLPKLENFLKLADRNYGAKDYAEAMNYYSKIIELDPDNPHALIRKGICKALESGYEKFEVDAMVHGLKYAYEGIKNNKEALNTYVAECFEVVKVYDKLLVDKYKERNLSLSDVNPFNEKIKKCVDSYEYLNQIVENKALKINILKCLIQALSNLILNKEYKTVVNGRIVFRDCSWNKTYKSQLEERKRKYTNELNMIVNPEQAQKDAGKKTNTSDNEVIFWRFIKMKKQSLDILYYIFAVVCGLLAVISLLSSNFTAFLMFGFVCIMSLPPIRDLYIDKKYKDRMIICCLKIFVFITALFYFVLI